MGQAIRNPILRDQLADSAAGAMDRLDVPAKRIARSVGVEDRSARRWAREGRGNPLYPVTLLTYEAARICGSEPFEIVAHIRAVAAQGLMADLSNAGLVERFWALVEDETQAQGEASLRQVAFWRSGDQDGLAAALLHHAARLEALAAVTLELKLRGIDPRSPEFRQ